MASQHLTKSRYTAALQCPRRLWLMVHEPLPRDDPAPGSLLEIGQEIGRQAHLLFPGGVLVEEEPWQHAQAVQRTSALMRLASVPAIFEAAFEHDGIRIRVDVLERLQDDSWGLREVKSTTSMKEHHLDDLAVQAFVLAGLGIAISSIELVHVNGAYVRGSGAINWVDFFARDDAGDRAASAVFDVAGRLPSIRNFASMDVPPAAEPGKRCKKPYDCEFWDRCIALKPADWIGYLPRLSQLQAEELRMLGIEAISSIPMHFPLTAKQRIIWDVTTNGQPFISPDLAQMLSGMNLPACYLDFEAMSPPMPLYPGTRPFQTIPFQWSLHAIDVDGVLHHREFLAAGNEDPRRQFTETLLSALTAFPGPIMVYSPYEKTRLQALALEFLELRLAIDVVIARLVDLLPIIRNAMYLPDFHFSNSIKFVAPALSPGFSYSSLDGVAGGAAASASFIQLASGSTSNAGEADRLRAALLAYCRHDTLAMVEVHKALLGLADRADDTAVEPGA